MTFWLLIAAAVASGFTAVLLGSEALEPEVAVAGSTSYGKTPVRTEQRANLTAVSDYAHGDYRREVRELRHVALRRVMITVGLICGAVVWSFLAVDLARHLRHRRRAPTNEMPMFCAHSRPVPPGSRRPPPRVPGVGSN